MSEQDGFKCSMNPRLNPEADKGPCSTIGEFNSAGFWVGLVTVEDQMRVQDLDLDDEVIDGYYLCAHHAMTMIGHWTKTIADELHLDKQLDDILEGMGE